MGIYGAALRELEQYRRDEAAGLLLRLPVPLGATVWRVRDNPACHYGVREAEKFLFGRVVTPRRIVEPIPFTLALLDAWTDEIAQGLAGMVHIFNPQLILIGGGVSAQQKLLIAPIAAKVKASVMPAFAQGLEVRAAQLHNDAGMVGAVYYFRQTMEEKE